MENAVRSGLRCFLGIVFVAVLCLANAYAAKSIAFVPDELLVQPKAGVTGEQMDKILKGSNATVIGEIPQIRVKHIKVPAHALEKVRLALSRNPHIDFVEYNHLADETVIPNDPWYSSQWHHPKIHAPGGWYISTGSYDIPIAIADSGVDLTHPDLSGKILDGYNFFSNNTDTNDLRGHGTSVAGAAAAMTNNAKGVAGVAWENPIMPLVISDPSTGRATYSNMAKAIIYAADHGVRVINMSFSGTSSSSTLQNAVNYAWNKGAVFFASAGNAGSSTPVYPAACDNAVAVSATTSSDAIASFSNYGDWIDIAAPGSSIYTTGKDGGYRSASGTSFSSPIAAGLAALLFSVNPGLSNAMVVDFITQNADDLGAPGFDPYYGHGRINVYKSLLAATNTWQEPDTTPPDVAITAPADGAVIHGSVTVMVSATDNAGIVKVELYLNGSLYATGTTAPYNFHWDTTQYPDGMYSLEAKAYDPSGNMGQSNTIFVSVSNPSDTVPPTVSINEPGSGAYVRHPQKIHITASDNIGVEVIELYIDNDLKRAVYGQNSLTYNWNTRKESGGAHVITAKGYDAAGNVGMDSVTVYK